MSDLVTTPLKRRFFSSFVRNEVKIQDSTAITMFMQCHRKYFYRMVLGYKSNKKEPYFTFGSAYHLFREVLERQYFDDPTLPLDRYLLKALEAATKLWDKEYVPVDPDSKWVWMTKDRLVRSCLYVFNEKWKPEKIASHIKVIGIEQPFLITLSDGIVIAGRFDQVINWKGKIWGRDFKTSSQDGYYYDNTLNPNDQFSRYTYAENLLSGYNFDVNSRPPVEGQYIEVLFNRAPTKKDPNGRPKVEPKLAYRTRAELIEWLEEQYTWHKIMDLVRERDNWPKNPKSCTFCEYRRVCTAGNESQQMTELKNSFVYDPWDCQKSAGKEE